MPHSSSYIHSKPHSALHFSKLKNELFKLLLLGICSGPLMAQDMLISGVVDGPLTGGTPKAIEVFVVNDIFDLSACGLGSANNGGGTDGQEFTFPADGATAGTFLYVASEIPGFLSFFGFEPDYTSSAASINGDDAIELFCNGSVIDVFGDINVDGTGQPWDHLDGWAYRVSNTGPDGSAFTIANWTFSGINALDGELDNNTAAIPFPIGSYMRGGGPVETAPFVVGTSPNNGASGVALDSAIDINFSEPVNAVNGWYTVSCDSSGIRTATESGGPQAFSLAVDGDFDNSETCTVTVDAALVTDVDSDDPPDNMDANFVFEFETAAAAMPDSIIINEIMQNPNAVSDSNGEWMELFNSTDIAIDIDGWKMKDNGSNSHTINNGGPLLIAAGGFLVLGNNSDAGSNGGLQVDYQYSSGFALSNGDDEIILLDGSDAEVDRVEWDGGSQYPDPTGASMALIDPLLDNNVGSNWCESASSYGAGDFGTPGQSNDCGFKPVINEIDYDQPGSDTAEFIEIKNRGTEAGDLSTLSLELINGNGGAVYASVTLPAVDLNPGDYFVVCIDAATVANCDLEAFSSIQNGSPDAVAITSSGIVLDAVSYEGDTAAPYTEGSGAGLADSGLSGQDFKSISRLPDGVDSNRNNLDLQSSCISPGAANTSISSGCTALGPVLAIHDLQGSGLQTPYAGQALGSNGNVVTALSADGFFMQATHADYDADPDTSEGIFVFTGAVPAVSVGDVVDVFGTVVEFFDFTEINATSVQVTGSAALPDAVILDANTPSPDPMSPSCSIEFECIESMLVQITGGTVTGPNQRFGSDVLAEVYITAAGERTFREPGLEFPGLPGLPEWDGNPEVFELDPNKLGLPNQAILAGSHFDAVGVIGYEFGGYELWPSELTVYPATLPDGVRERADGEMTVAALNLFRLFDDIDDAPVPRIDPETGIDYGPTDEAVLDSAEYAVRLSKFSGFIRGVMDSPDILAVSEVESVKVLQDLAAQIQADDASLNYSAYLEEGNDIGGIDVGFLVLDTVVVDNVTQLGRFELLSVDASLLNDRPPLLLEARQVADGSDFPISVMAIHGRSLGGIDSTRTQQKRYEQGQYVASQVQALQLANPDIHLVVTGDFNAHEFTDGYVDVTGQMKGDYTPADNLVCQSNSCDDLVEPNLINQVLMIPQGERYSFNFRGNAQVLDHALTSQALDELVRDFSYARGNSDAALDYIFDANTVLRSSDHDGLVLFLSKDSDGDGVSDNLDVCAGTMIPEGAAALGLGTNRWALTDDDRIFDTTAPKGKGPQQSFDIFDTAGCSCEQIVEQQQLGEGHFKHGCSGGVMKNWVDLVSQP
jgi:predicted extracellular nuclease